MPNQNNEEYIVKKMNVKFKKDEYQKFINGETHSDKGIRNEDGRLSSFPDLEEIPIEDDYIYDSFDYNHDYSKAEDDQATAEALGYILGILLVGIEILSDENNRKAIKSWWDKNVVLNAKNVAHSISNKLNSLSLSTKNIFSGKTKASQLMIKYNQETGKPVYVKKELLQNSKQSTKNQKKFISQEEANQQLEQIKMLTVLLAGKIKEFSNSYIRDDLSPEEMIEQQNALKELTTHEVTNMMNYLLTNDNFKLDESTSLIFNEFLKGNILVENKKIPIIEINSKEINSEID